MKILKQTNIHTTYNYLVLIKWGILKNLLIENIKKKNDFCLFKFFFLKKIMFINSIWSWIHYRVLFNYKDYVNSNDEINGQRIERW